MSACYILHVEDDANDVVLVRHAFNRGHLAVTLEHVPDGQQAVDYLSGVGQFGDRARFPLPHLLLLDLKLPALSGFEVLAWTRQTAGLKNLPVYILSSSDHPDDLDRAHALGADQYFLKTPGFTDLVEQVRNLAERLAAAPAAVGA